MSEVLRAAEWTDGLRDLVTSVTIVLTGLVLYLIFKRKDWL